MLFTLFNVSRIKKTFGIDDIKIADKKVCALMGRSNEEWGFSVLFDGKVKYISERKYGLYLNALNKGLFIKENIDIMELENDAVAIHYFKNHPWEIAYGYFHDYWWNYAGDSPYYDEFYRELYGNALTNYNDDLGKMSAEEFLIDCFLCRFAIYREKNIVLYGAGNKCSLLLRKLDNWNLVAVLDEDMSKYGKYLEGHEIINKQNIPPCVDVIIITARPIFFDEIASRIRCDEILNKYLVYYLDGRRVC